MRPGTVTARRSLLFANILVAIVFVFPNAAVAACCGCRAATAPTQNICIQTTKDCATLKDKTTNAAIKTLSDCSTVIDVSQCKPVDKGVCVFGPVDETAYTAETSGDTATPAVEKVPGGFTSNVPIPGLEFSSELTAQNGYLSIPYFAQFVSAIQRYLTGIAVTAAAVMIVYGGFLYIMSASGANVRSGKTIIRDAVIGLILALSAYLILNVINPSLVNLDAIRIQKIVLDPSLIGNYNPAVPIEKDPKAPVVLKEAGTGTQHGFDPKLVALAAQHGIVVDDKIFDDIIKGAKEAGLDACLMLANCEHETRFIPSWQGWYSGAKKEDQSHFGACGLRADFLAPGGPYYDRLRKQFPDFPDLPSGKLTKENRLRIADWIMTNHEGDAFAASLMMLDNFKILKNEVQGVAAFKAGTTSIQKNAAANNCTPKLGIHFAQALNNPQQALTDSCIPHFVSIPSIGDPPKGCPEDKYLCTDPKPDKTSSWVGHCSDGRKCYAMLADESVTYIMDAYPKLKQAHPSCQ